MVNLNKRKILYQSDILSTATYTYAFTYNLSKFHSRMGKFILPKLNGFRSQWMNNFVDTVRLFPDRSILDKHETGRAESEARYLTVSDNRDVTISTKLLTLVLIKPS